MLKKRFKSAKKIDGVIDLERLRSGPAKCIERDPEQFFDLTYPSEDLHSMLRPLSLRFAGERVEGDGIIVAEAVKGLGKSHALLTAYHLFANDEPAKGWMQDNGYNWNPPQKPIIIIKKFTDQYLPFDSLWSVIDEELDSGWTQDHPPSLDEFRASIGDRYLILIFDELERGLSNILNPAKRSQNLTFLQMLSEEANRNRQVTLFAAFYDGSVEPGATLKRITPRVELRFRNPEDRAAIVRHRLFANADSYDRSAADALIRSYVNAWKQHGVETSEDFMARIKKTFPFIPGLIELVFERISGSGGFQGTRGALGLMAAMVDANPGGSYLLTAAHCKLTDKACANRLQDLDPAGNLINCAQRNFQDLKNQPYAEPLASAVLVASLTPGVKGLTREELVRHEVVPGSDPNQFESTLQAFRTYGSYFHEREGRFFFDLEENENAKVEIEAIGIGDERAREEVITIWKQDLFGETQQSVVFTDVETTKNALDHLPKNTLRFVLSPRRLSSFERHAIYFGSELRNQILLFEPREETANLLINQDIIASTKRSMAAGTLTSSAGSPERRNRYERISQQERGNVKGFIKSAGLVYIRVESWDENAEGSIFEIEPLDQAYGKQAVLEFLRRQIYPRPLYVEHIKENLDSFYDITISQVERTYKSTLSFPVPIMVPDVSDAVVAVVEDRERILGLQHQRRNFCSEHVTLGIGELPEATLARPWPATPPSHVSGTPGPIPPEPGPEPHEPSPEPETPVPGHTFEERGTPSCQSLGELRQAVAERLSDIEGNLIQNVRFQVFVQYANINLSDLPSALRGSLSETGDLEAQIDLSVPGPMNKAKMESLCESLPNLTGGIYMARMRLIIRNNDKDTG
jgi:hypothetical protein